MSSSHRFLRKFMKKHHSFLFKLYQEKRGWKNRDTISKARNVQVRLLLRLLFCISAGHIPIRKSDFEEIVRSKRRILLRNVKYIFRKLRKDSIKKLKVLC